MPINEIRDRVEDLVEQVETALALAAMCRALIDQEMALSEHEPSLGRERFPGRRVVDLTRFAIDQSLCIALTRLAEPRPKPNTSSIPRLLSLVDQHRDAVEAQIRAREAQDDIASSLPSPAIAATRLKDLTDAETRYRELIGSHHWRNVLDTRHHFVGHRALDASRLIRERRHRYEHHFKVCMRIRDIVDLLSWAILDYHPPFRGVEANWDAEARLFLQAIDRDR